MVNFSPRIEDSTEEQLLNNIDEHNPSYGIISSNELLKRTINKLEKTIEIFNKESSKQTGKMLFLTYTTTFLTVVMVIGLIIQIILAFKTY